MKKVAIVFFGPISTDRSLINFASYNNEIVQEFSKKGTLYKVFCKDFTPMPEVQADQVKVFSGSLFSRVALVLHKVLKPFTTWTERMFFEKAFDLFVKYHIDYRQFDLLLLLRETNPELCRKAKQKGKTVCGLASIYYPRIIFDKILEAEKKWGVKEESNYTSEKRMKIYDDVIAAWDRVISLSGSPLTQRLLAHTHYFDKTVFPSHEFGVDRETFFPTYNRKEEEKVVFMATTDDTLKKGLYYLLAAWEKVEEKTDNISLLVIGEIGENLNPRIQNFRLKHVIYPGYRKDLHHYYQQSDVFISPSIIDMGPRTIKQAMASGNMVISSSACGASSFINEEKEGFIYDANDIDRLAELIIWCARNKKKVAEMGKAAHEKSNVFDNNLFAEEVYNITMN